MSGVVTDAPVETGARALRGHRIAWTHAWQTYQCSCGWSASEREPLPEYHAAAVVLAATQVQRAEAGEE